MAYETLIVVFGQPDQANAAIQALRRLGVPARDIKRHPADVSTAQDVAPPDAAFPEKGFWSWLFSREVDEKEQAALQRGGTVISVRVLDDELGSVRSELEHYSPLDIEDPQANERN